MGICRLPKKILDIVLLEMFLKHLMQGGLKNQADLAVIQGKAVIQNAHDLYMFSIDKIIKSEKVDWLCKTPAV